MQSNGNIYNRNGDVYNGNVPFITIDIFIFNGSNYISPIKNSLEILVNMKSNPKKKKESIISTIQPQRREWRHSCQKAHGDLAYLEPHPFHRRIPKVNEPKEKGTDATPSQKTLYKTTPHSSIPTNTPPAETEDQHGRI